MAIRLQSWALLNFEKYLCRNSKGRTNLLRQTIALILLCFLSSGCGVPWVNSTCPSTVEESQEYGTKCDDEFQKILDKDSINFNITGMYHKYFCVY